MAKSINYPVFLWRVTASHTISYFILGIIASIALDYKTLFENENFSCFMKPIDSIWVSAGPLLQIIRGFIFSIALWIIKDQFVYQSHGWLKLWGIIALLCVFSPTGPAPGSIEGFIYTKVPFFDQVKGYLEVLPQTLLFSFILFNWFEKMPRWWNTVSIILFTMICFMSGMAILVHFYPMVN